MKLSIQSFLGIAPRVPPRYLPDGGAQIATNVEATGQSVKPLLGLGASLLSMSGTSGLIQSIYRWGQDLTSETQYWFRWITDVDVCRSQISGDTAEWTVFTGDGYPKATYGGIATQGTTNYPAAALRLGLPAPTTALTASAALPAYCEVNGVRDNTLTTQATCIAKPNGVWIVGAKGSAATVTLTAAVLASITSGYGLKLSTNNGANFVTVQPSSGGAPAVTVTSAMLDQMSELYGIKVSVDNGLTYATGALDTTISQNADLTLWAGEIAAFPYQTTVTIAVTGYTTVSINAKTLTSPAAVVSALNSQAASLVTASIAGSGVYVRTVAKGAGITLTITWAANAYRTATGASLSAAQNNLIAAIASAKINGVALASASISGTDVIVTAATTGASVKLVVRWGDSDSFKLSKTGSAPDTSGLKTLIDTMATSGTYSGVTAKQVGDTLVLTSKMLGSTATLRAQWGEMASQFLSATGGVQDLGTPETRVYTYTWVLKESGVTWESAPYTATTMPTIDVYAGGSVTLSGFTSVTELSADGWGPRQGLLYRRIYRAVEGVYLFVTELPAATASWTDTLSAASLGEPLPSTLWTPPKATLKGIINLPNGIIAGFDGRDVFFSEPYRPYAWPNTYIMTVDYPVVGLGRMDTTLVVLTTGVPYFIQGSAPDVMVMVKSDIEQACVSKRSIVSVGGTVLYASPDGIMVVSSGGSSMLTEGVFTRAQWQAYNPSSIQAYGHDNQYIAFCERADGSKGGFIIDLKTKQFSTHNLWATAGYNDLRNDSLYLCDASKNLVKWYAGVNTAGKWRSKLFSHPQPLGYSCVQVEAESYPLTCRIYCDGVQVKAQTIPNSTYYTGTFLIAKRAPFRLPVAHGRDWEVELDVAQEIFNVVLAQSPSELATA
jgi:hypothetical protein